MQSEKQRQASRANGARSRGPVTPQGKRNSSRNSYRHGLLASTVVLEGEAGDRFHDLFIGLCDEYQPTTLTQMCLVETMAAARWRLLRIWGAQKTALDRGIAFHNPAIGQLHVRILYALGGSSDQACSPELLMRYEIAYDRQFSRALSRLILLQSQSRVGEPGPYFPDAPITWNPPDEEELDDLDKSEAAPADLDHQEAENQTEPSSDETDEPGYTNQAGATNQPPAGMSPTRRTQQVVEITKRAVPVSPNPSSATDGAPDDTGQLDAAHAAAEKNPKRVSSKRAGPRADSRGFLRDTSV